MTNKLTQKAGENSQQFQANQVVVNVGIDEKRAREIYQEMNLQVRKDYTQEALTLANTRVIEFENKLLPKMEAIDGALEAFADPSFQILLVEAQKKAASTERAADYDLLSELLIHRFQNGKNRITRAGINRAVEIVDQISDEALLGLTVFHSVSQFTPVSGDIQQGLDALNNLFGKLVFDKLPTGSAWLDHLDILDAIRINSLVSLKKINQYFPERLPGYIANGIEKDSDNYNKAQELMAANLIPQTILVEHALNNKYFRLNITDQNQIDSLLLRVPTIQNGKTMYIQTPFNSNQKSVLNQIYSLYNQDDTIKQANINVFMEEWDKRSSLKIVREWWDSITTSIQITSVGRVLAHSNAQRCDKSLPSLNE